MISIDKAFEIYRTKLAEGHSSAKLFEDLEEEKLKELRYKNFLRGMKEKGYIQPRTRSTLAWKLRERPSFASKFEWLNPAVPEVDWDYAPVGEGTSWRVTPRTRVGHVEEIQVWVRMEKDATTKRRVLADKKFYHACETAKCNKKNCAVCCAVKEAQIGRNEVFSFVRVPITGIKVVDSATAGIAESGNRPKGERVPASEDKAVYAIISTQREYKKGSKAKWR